MFGTFPLAFVYYENLSRSSPSLSLLSFVFHTQNDDRKNIAASFFSPLTHTIPLNLIKKKIFGQRKVFFGLRLSFMCAFFSDSNINILLRLCRRVDKMRIITLTLRLWKRFFFSVGNYRRSWDWCKKTDKKRTFSQLVSCK